MKEVFYRKKLLQTHSKSQSSLLDNFSLDLELAVQKNTLNYLMALTLKLNLGLA
jgi:hypothetical protein